MSPFELWIPINELCFCVVSVFFYLKFHSIFPIDRFFFYIFWIRARRDNSQLVRYWPGQLNKIKLKKKKIVNQMFDCITFYYLFNFFSMLETKIIVLYFGLIFMINLNMVYSHYVGLWQNVMLYCGTTPRVVRIHYNFVLDDVGGFFFYFLIRCSIHPFNIMSFDVYPPIKFVINTLLFVHWTLIQWVIVAFYDGTLQ